MSKKGGYPNHISDVRSMMVVKANELIQKSRFTLSLQQQKVVLYLISQITPYDEDFHEYEFSISEFCKICGLDGSSGKNYSSLKASIKDIADQSVWVDLGNGKETLIRWIEKPYIDKQSGVIRIRLDEDLKPYLLQLKQNYTQYELLWTLRFRSKYSIRLYELIKSIHYRELETYERTYSLEELQQILDAKIYKSYSSFRTRALDPAIEEINNYSDKNVTYSPIRSGRSVDKIKFTISSKDGWEALKLRSSIEHELGIDQPTFWDLLVDGGHAKEEPETYETVTDE